MNPMGVLRGPHVRPAVFGAFDGLTAVLGVLLTLTGHPSLVIPTAAGVAIAEAIGMFFGEWLSDSDNGFGASAVIGAASLVGSMGPALPWAWLSGSSAITASAAVLVGLAAAITVLRGAERGWLRAATETYGILAVAIASIAVVEWLLPSGAAG